MSRPLHVGVQKNFVCIASDQLLATIRCVGVTPLRVVYQLVCMCCRCALEIKASGRRLQESIPFSELNQTVHQESWPELGLGLTKSVISSRPFAPSSIPEALAKAYPNEVVSMKLAPAISVCGAAPPTDLERPPST